MKGKDKNKKVKFKMLPVLHMFTIFMYLTRENV